MTQILGRIMNLKAAGKEDDWQQKINVEKVF